MILTGSVRLGTQVSSADITVNLETSFIDSSYICLFQLVGIGESSSTYSIFADVLTQNTIKFQSRGLYRGTIPFLCYGRWRNN